MSVALAVAGLHSGPVEIDVAWNHEDVAPPEAVAPVDVCTDLARVHPDEGLDLEVEVSTGKDLGDGLINERNHRHIIFREYAVWIVGLQLNGERIKVIFS